MKSLKKHLINPMCLLVLSYSTLCSAIEPSTYLKYYAYQFKQLVNPSYTLKNGSWQWFDVEGCFQSADTATCWGTNPDSPYGFPVFLTSNVLSSEYQDYLLNIRGNQSIPNLSSIWQMRQDAAVVVFMVTPPKVRYFGLSGLLKDHPAWMQNTAAELDIYASLADTLNILTMEKFDPITQQPTTDPVSKIAVIIFTANESTFNDLATKINQATNIPLSAINYLPLPEKVPSNLGELNLVNSMADEGLGDTFSMILRLALPDENQRAEYDAYIHNDNVSEYFKVFHLTPNQQEPFIAKQEYAQYSNDTSPIDEYAINIDGYGLEQLLNYFHNEVTNAIEMQFPSTRKVHPIANDNKEYGLECISKVYDAELNNELEQFYMNAPRYTCGADNYDPIYTMSIRPDGYFVKNPNTNQFVLLDTYQIQNNFRVGDYIVVTGVNHTNLQTSSYVNHVISDMDKNVGVLSINDTAFNQLDNQENLINSTATLIGLQPNQTELYNLLQEYFYSLVIAYDCTGFDMFCYEIPTDQSGSFYVIPEQGFSLVGRMYLNPQTNVKPANEQMIMHRVTILDND